MVRDTPSEAARVRSELADWFGAIERTRDLTRRDVPTCADPHEIAAAHTFVAGMRREMLDFRTLVDAAVVAAVTNARQLCEIVANTTEQAAMVRRAAAAVAGVDRGALHLARTADALRHTAADAATATLHSDAAIDEMMARLADLARTIGSATTFAAATEHAVSGVGDFVARLRAIAREARVLGINAAIEAAHLDLRKSGFGNVASEVNALAASTGQSATDVATIRKNLHAASEHVVATIALSATIVEKLASDVAAARGHSTQSRAQVDRLDAAIAAVSHETATQSAQLTAIASGIERCAQDAHEVQTAAERASTHDLGASLDALQATIARYALGGGAEPAVVASAASAAFVGATASAAASLRARVDADQRDLLERISRLSVAIARNAYEWKEIAAALTSLRGNLAATAQAIDETFTAARRADAASKHMRASLEDLRNGFGAAVGELETSLASVTRVRATVRASESSVAETGDAGARAGSILTLIDTISSDTTLLALNAAIEAAHAGAAGSGFGVIATEIRGLAQTTLDATGDIGRVLADVAAASDAMRETTAAAVAHTDDVGERTAAIRESLVGLRAQLEQTLQNASDTASVVDAQIAAIGDMRSIANTALARIDADFGAVTDGGWLELATLGTRAHTLAARRPLGTVAEEIRAIGMAVAQRMDGVFDDAIARGTIALDDCFDSAYDELTGAKIAQLARLFDVTKVPASGFDPPKFATRFDRAVEDGFMAIIDECVPVHAALTALVAVDLNGYCFAHYRACRQAWTGDYRTDLTHNRIKRFFDDELSLRCARVGLGTESNGLPPRTARRTFADLGCSLDATSERPWGIFTFLRDTGVVYNDLSIGLFAQKRRVATIRILFDADLV
jgi:methyl-accepting chemotaxis protein